MAKFRNLIKDLGYYVYFENGFYFTQHNKTSDKRLEIKGDKYTEEFWKNAEQSTVISCSNSDKVECFENDYLEIRYSYNHWAGTLEGTMEETVEGVLKLDEFGFYISNEVLDIYLLELPTIVSVVVKKGLDNEA